MRRRPHSAGIGLAIGLVLASGCASPRSARFDSQPAGARVTIGARTYETPCWTTVYRRDRSAVFTWPEGASSTVPIPRAPGVLSGVRHACFKAGSGALAVTGVVIGGLGLVVTGGMGLVCETEGDLTDSELAAMWCGLGALGMGGVLVWAGESVKHAAPLPADRTVHITGTLPEAPPAARPAGAER